MNPQPVAFIVTFCAPAPRLGPYPQKLYVKGNQKCDILIIAKYFIP